jgi:hypothetical protein
MHPVEIVYPVCTRVQTRASSRAFAAESTIWVDPRRVIAMSDSSLDTIHVDPNSPHHPTGLLLSNDRKNTRVPTRPFPPSTGRE